MFSNRVLCILSFCIIFSLQNSQPAEMNKLNNNPKTPWNATATDRLKHDLLMHYDKFARPMQHYNTTTVEVGLTILHIELNEFKNTFTVHSWIRMIWNDEKLKWNASDYEGLATLHVADHEIWQPDIVPYNSAAGSTIDHYANTHCLVSDDGSVTWVPAAQFVVFCELNLRYWPFDEQNCMIKFGSWTYDGNAIDLQVFDANKSQGIDKEHMLVSNSEWKIVKTTSEKETIVYQCCPMPWVSINFEFIIQRTSATYKAIIITPAFAVIIMTLLSFWLPSHAGEKIILNCCTAVIICLFLLFFSQKCPAMGENTPLIVFFYSSSLYVISFCLIGSVLVIWISRTQHHRSLPWILKHALTGWLGKWLGLNSYISQTSIGGTNHQPRVGSIASDEELRNQLQHSSHVGLDHADENATDEHHILGTLSARFNPGTQHHDWLLLAAAIDRLSFVFYAFLFIIFAIAYSL